MFRFQQAKIDDDGARQWALMTVNDLRAIRRYEIVVALTLKIIFVPTSSCHAKKTIEFREAFKNVLADFACPLRKKTFFFSH